MDVSTYKLCGVALLVSMAMLVMRKVNKEYEAPLLLVGTVALTGAALVMVEGIVEYFLSLCDASALSGDTITLLVRALGIVMLTKISSDMCRGMGASGVGDALEYVGKLQIVLLSLPLIQSALDAVRGLLAEGGL